MAVSFEQLKQIICENLPAAEKRPDLVVPEASFKTDLGADSLDAVELVLALEEELGIEIPDEVAEHFNTVGDLTKYFEGIK